MRLVNPIRIISSLATIGLLAASGTSYAAGTAAFSLSSVSATEGDTATVAIYEDGTSVNVVTATFTYDTSKLQLVSGNCAGAFSATAASSSSSISCFVPGGGSAVSGSNEVATLSFKTVAAGIASVTVTGSQIASSGTNVWNGSSASSTVTVSAPAPQPAPTTTTRSTSSSKPTAPVSSTPATTPATTTTTTVSGSTSSKPATQNKHSSSKPAPIKSHHTGLVTSTLIGLLIIAFAVYWILVRKRPEEVAPAVYKLNGTGKTTSSKTQRSKSSKKPSSRTTTAKKAPVRKAVKK